MPNRGAGHTLKSDIEKGVEGEEQECLKKGLETNSLRAGIFFSHS